MVQPGVIITDYYLTRGEVGKSWEMRNRLRFKSLLIKTLEPWPCRSSADVAFWIRCTRE
jgi:hypothetical protein